MDASDRGCVKTHTLEKCRKYNSPTRHPTACRQNHQFSCRTISAKYFYPRGRRLSFYTPKTHSGLKPACLFVDILRPSACPAVFAFIVGAIYVIMRSAKSIFYKQWKVVQVWSR